MFCIDCRVALCIPISMFCCALTRHGWLLVAQLNPSGSGKVASALPCAMAGCRARGCRGGRADPPDDRLQRRRAPGRPSGRRARSHGAAPCRRALYEPQVQGRHQITTSARSQTFSKREDTPTGTVEVEKGQTFEDEVATPLRPPKFKVETSRRQVRRRNEVKPHCTVVNRLLEIETRGAGAKDASL